MTTSKHKYIYWLLIVLVAILVIFSAYYFMQTKELKNTVENNYNRAFHELVNYVDDIDTLLEKSMLVSGAEQMSTMSSELFRQSTAAKACLGQLPISEVQLENTEKFLSQVGDYTYLLSQEVIGNNQLTEEEYNTLSQLSSYASALNTKLLAMQQDIYDGNISFGTVGKKSNLYFDNAVSADSGDILSDFETVEKEFQEYPALIYDGPFSEHIENLKPAMLENLEVMDSDDVLKKARDFLENRGQKLAFSGESKNTALESYSYSSNADGREIYISLTKKGGIPIYFLDTRAVGEEQLTFKDAITKAADFLNKRGFTSMKESYYEKTDGVATVNFAYKQGDVICYSDLIKVKVALDNGEILGMEAHGYIMNHKHRDFSQIKLTQEEALSKVNKHLQVKATNPALIPKDSMREVLCYELKGNHNGKNFLIYINAETGKEEKILMLIESEEGILTI